MAKKKRNWMENFYFTKHDRGLSDYYAYRTERGNPRRQDGSKKRAKDL